MQIAGHSLAKPAWFSYTLELDRSFIDRESFYDIDEDNNNNISKHRG